LRYQRNLYIAEKRIWWVTILSLTIRVYLHSFCCYCLRNTRNVAKFQKIDLTAVQGHPRSSILVSIESPYVTSLIVTLAVSVTVFEIFTVKDRKLLILPTPPLFDAPARGNPLEFLNETYHAKTRGMGLPYGENFIILTSTVFV